MQLGELGHGRAAVPRDFQLVIGVGRFACKREAPQLLPVGEVFAGPGVQFHPIGSVHRAVQGPVRGVAAILVAARAHHISVDDKGLRQLEGNRNRRVGRGGGGGQVLAAGIKVEKLALGLAGAEVLAAGNGILQNIRRRASGGDALQPQLGELGQRRAPVFGNTEFEILINARLRQVEGYHLLAAVKGHAGPDVQLHPVFIVRGAVERPGGGIPALLVAARTQAVSGDLASPFQGKTHFHRLLGRSLCTGYIFAVGAVVEQLGLFLAVSHGRAAGDGIRQYQACQIGNRGLPVDLRLILRFPGGEKLELGELGHRRAVVLGYLQLVMGVGSGGCRLVFEDFPLVIHGLARPLIDHLPVLVLHRAVKGPALGVPPRLVGSGGNQVGCDGNGFLGLEGDHHRLVGRGFLAG